VFVSWTSLGQSNAGEFSCVFIYKAASVPEDQLWRYGLSSFRRFPPNRGIGRANKLDDARSFIDRRFYSTLFFRRPYYLADVLILFWPTAYLWPTALFWPTAFFFSYLTLACGLIIWPTALFYLTLADGLINRALERILREGRFADTRRPGVGPLPGACTCHDHGLLATGHSVVGCWHSHLASEISE
jgi:hypothetical protein